MIAISLQLQQYKNEMQDELQQILQYWQHYTVDETYGGFVGEVDAQNIIHPSAPKGAVLNARILWSFAAAFNSTNNPSYLQLADRAFHYLSAYFFDKEHGGVFWSVDYTGKPLDTKKQVYAISFVMYALAEYYRAKPNEFVKQQAIDLYRLIIQHAYDKINGGFIEALTINWQPIKDFRLSDKDANTPKSMNTMLHVLEAFTNLYRIWADEDLCNHIKKLLNIFDTHIINKKTCHLHLFFDNDWTVKGNDISFGHDIEAAWLLQEAAEVIGDEKLISRVSANSLLLVAASEKGLDTDGGLWYEASAGYKHWVYEKHWWPQAEAMIGFFNAYQFTGNEKYLQQSLSCWQFVKNKLKDTAGEWHWGIRNSGALMNKDKAGFWKCPYHNSRACMELIKRIDYLLQINKSN